MTNTQRDLEDSHCLLLAALTLHGLVGQQELARRVEAVALRVNDGTMERVK